MFSAVSPLSTDGSNGQITWDTYKTSKGKVVPSVANPDLYASAQFKFASIGITTGGYIAWNPASGAAAPSPAAPARPAPQPAPQPVAQFQTQPAPARAPAPKPAANTPPAGPSVGSVDPMGTCGGSFVCGQSSSYPCCSQYGW